MENGTSIITTEARVEGEGTECGSDHKLPTATMKYPWKSKNQQKDTEEGSRRRTKGGKFKLHLFRDESVKALTEEDWIVNWRSLALVALEKYT